MCLISCLHLSYGIVPIAQVEVCDTNVLLTVPLQPQRKKLSKLTIQLTSILSQLVEHLISRRNLLNNPAVKLLHPLFLLPE